MLVVLGWRRTVPPPTLWGHTIDIINTAGGLTTTLDGCCHKRTRLHDMYLLDVGGDSRSFLISTSSSSKVMEGRKAWCVLASFYSNGCLRRTVLGGLGRGDR